MKIIGKGISVLVMLWALTACFSNQQEPEAITDPFTEKTIEVITEHERAPGHFIVHHGYDNMDRGSYDLTGKIVIDPVHYDSHDVQRGDIVYYEPPEEMQEKMGKDDISRVVGLPGEHIKIIEGQIYIDGKLLDTFYGRAHRLGADLDRLKEALQKDDISGQLRQNVINNVEYFENTNMDEISIAKDSIFVVGDDWFRSNDSIQFGPIPMDSIGGKVMGEAADK